MHIRSQVTRTRNRPMSHILPCKTYSRGWVNKIFFPITRVLYPLPIHAQSHHFLRYEAEIYRHTREFWCQYLLSRRAASFSKDWKNLIGVKSGFYRIRKVTRSPHAKSKFIPKISQYIGDIACFRENCATNWWKQQGGSLFLRVSLSA